MIGPFDIALRVNMVKVQHEFAVLQYSERHINHPDIVLCAVVLHCLCKRLYCIVESVCGYGIRLQRKQYNREIKVVLFSKLNKPIHCLHIHI